MRVPAASLAVLLSSFALVGSAAVGDEPMIAFFADGYHGGVYGHYPPGYTGFLVAQLKAHPGWKINLEIEPDTWDVARISEPEAYRAFKAIMADQSDAGRIEIVNPTYAQSYLFQSSGESVIRQFDYGIRKLRAHFPDIRLSTYSSEEPCFTSCLPQVLKSFGYEFAVLKNPDTCWGGYTSAYGGELVNWIGPDGTAILTVPRYACEALQPGSSWQTIAWRNSPEYIEACLKQGIAHPVGMCLQDAGWRGGPWLGNAANGPRVQSKYITWRDYIRNVTPAKTDDNWRFTQEDVKPGLMWGSQVLQRIARQSREAEHRLLIAEKVAAMAFVDAGRLPMTDAFAEAWRNVLLTQHHDCWIVPYNGRLGSTWADQVRRWTNLSNAVSDVALDRSVEALVGSEGGRKGRFVRLINPTAAALDTVTPIPIPYSAGPSRATSINADGRRFATQIATSDKPGQSVLLVRATLPPMGYLAVELRDDAKATELPVTTKTTGTAVVMESDLYRIEFDPKKGGTIRSLEAKRLGGREFVDAAHERRFNELRGHFYTQGGFHSSIDQPARVRIVEDGPLRATAEIAGTIAGQPFVQRVSITQGSPVIDCSVRIDWRGNPRIGEFDEKDGFKNRRRAAYDDRFKLLVQFPARLDDQKIARNAAFDVFESRLVDTFYNSWEGIKNNVILDWVDVTDGPGSHGLALFTDHTTSYAHGPGFPLSLTIQYAGKGLWGRDYRAEGTTEVRYALTPHAGGWKEAGISAIAANWQQPAIGATSRGGQRLKRSLIDPGKSGWEAPAMFHRDDALFVRLFNASGDSAAHDLNIGFDAGKIELVELDGRVIEELKTVVNDAGQRTVSLRIPRFGIRTLRFYDVKSTN
jgi:alpha-mannosidase